MPHTMLSPANTAATASATPSAAANTTLNNPRSYLTSPSSTSLIPSLTPASSPVSTLTAPLALKASSLHHAHDNTLSLPLGSTLTTIPRKSGNNRIGQSILGQLLAAHKPGRDHHTLSNDATLSHKTIRPQEQQRRSVLPTGWSMGLSSKASSAAAGLQGLFLAQPPPTRAPALQEKMATGQATPKSASRNVMENAEQSESSHPVLPSIWLESIISGLSRSDLNTPPHYATLPRVQWEEEQLEQHKQRPRHVRMLFSGLGQGQKHKPKHSVDEKKKRRVSGNNKSIAPSATTSTAATSHQTTKDTLSTPNSKVLSRRGSACEMALGNDARELFQQNRSKTLSSAVISSSIVPAKDSFRSGRQRSLDSSSANTSATRIHGNTPKSSTASAPTLTSSTTATTTTTRGRFTIESSAPLPLQTRTRTLSHTSSSPITSPAPLSQQSTDRTPTATRKGPPPAISIGRPGPSVSPSIPGSSSPRPSSPSMSIFRSSTSRSPTASIPSSPSLSPSTSFPQRSNGDQDYCAWPGAGDHGSNITSTPISIPRGVGKACHQRTHSNSSIQSSASSSSRRSQVIIPPPPSVASFQFASFSSIASSNSVTTQPLSSSNKGTGSPLSHSHQQEQQQQQQQQQMGSSERLTGHNNNLKNLSIQTVEDIVNKNDPDALDKRGSQVFQMETNIHPLDSTSGQEHRQGGMPYSTHQTMNRVHPHQEAIETPVEGGLDATGHGRGMSSVSAGYCRQRSLSATNLGSRPPPPPHSRLMNVHPQPQDSQHHHLPPSPRHPPPMHHRGSWAERPTRRSHGSVTAGVHVHSGRIESDKYPSLGPGFGPSALSSSYGSSSSTMSSSSSAHAEMTSDVVVVKKSATGRMFTVERTIPASPTKCSRFIVVSSTDDMCLPTSPSPPGTSSMLQK